MQPQYQDPARYALRETGNYFDLIKGTGYHNQPLTFHEFLSKPESLFMYEEDFMQMPGYIQDQAQISPVDEIARRHVVEYIMEQFEDNLLGMQNYERWAIRFKHKCEEVCPAFWSQVNLISLMTAHELERDENKYDRTNTGTTTRMGGSTVTSDQNGQSKTVGETTSVQDVDNKQLSDGHQKYAEATTLRAENIVDADIDYDFSNAADRVTETRTSIGDTRQHIEGKTNTDSTTDTTNHSVTTTAMNNSGDQVTNRGQDNQDLTNKMYAYELPALYKQAQVTLPLSWLYDQLRPMFYMLY